MSKWNYIAFNGVLMKTLGGVCSIGRNPRNFSNGSEAQRPEAPWPPKSWQSKQQRVWWSVHGGLPQHQTVRWDAATSMTAGWNGRCPAPSEAARWPRDCVRSHATRRIHLAVPRLSQRWTALRFVTCLHTAPATDFAVDTVHYQQLARCVNKKLFYVGMNVTFTNVVATALLSHSAAAGTPLVECRKYHRLIT
jgi:hypothetical protein